MAAGVLLAGFVALATGVLLTDFAVLVLALAVDLTRVALLATFLAGAFGAAAGVVELAFVVFVATVAFAVALAGVVTAFDWDLDGVLLTGILLF